MSGSRLWTLVRLDLTQRVRSAEEALGLSEG